MNQQKSYDTKRCPMCGEHKTVDHYYRIGRYLSPYCRECKKRYAREKKLEASMQEARTCKKCERSGLTNVDFYPSNPEACKKCYRAQVKVTRARSRADRKSGRLRDKHTDDPRFYMLRGAKQRAKEHGWAFDIELGDVYIPESCPVLGIRLQVNAGKARDDSPSLDRIDHRLGYVRGNVRVISYRANLLKNNASVQELELVLADLKDITRNLI